MDDKGGGGQPNKKGRSRQKKSIAGVAKNRGRVVNVFTVYKSTIVTVSLIVLMIVLLFGIFSQFQSPQTADGPVGEIAINYSTLLSQIQAGNVLVVTIHGNSADALLLSPLTATQPTQISEKQKQEQISAWTYYTGSYSGGTWNAQTLNVDPERMVHINLPADSSAQLVQALLSKHVTVNTQAPEQPSAWLGILAKFAPFLFLLFLVVLVLRPRNRARIPQNMNDQIARFTKRQGRQFNSTNTSSGQKVVGSDKKPSIPTHGMRGAVSRNAFTPSNASSATQSVKVPPSTTFADVAGIDEVRVELEEIVQFLRSPEKFERLGARIPRGALLVGPPGTGKTLLARAVAGEAGVAFFSISASEFVEMFVGVGASRVRDLFSQARQAAPAVIFIDEVDAVGRKRSVRAMGNEERDQTLNQLLVELDGFNERQAVVVLAATNRVDILDKALLRPGRFDRHITLSLPDRIGRQAILEIHTARTPLTEGLSLERLARMTTGMSGADLANLVNEAALSAARKNQEQVDEHCFEDALARVQLGALRPLIMSEAERRIIAHHESGHAIVGHYLKESDRVNRVTILPRGQSLGVTQFIAEEDRYNYSREMLMAKIAVGLGGRTAEELTFGRERVTTGAENDFQVVTGIARRMVTRWGMSDEVGVVFADTEADKSSLTMRRLESKELMIRSQSLAIDVSGHFIPASKSAREHEYIFAMTDPSTSTLSSPGMSTLVDREVKKIVDEGQAIARAILNAHSDQLELLARTLMEREQLGRSEFEDLMQQ